MGAVAPTPVRLRKTEDFLKGKDPEGDVIEKAAEITADEVKPITDVRSTADYRLEICKIVVKRLLKTAIGRVK